MVSKLLELIAALVNEEGLTWKQKREKILGAADENDKNNLNEFASWFTDD